MPCEAIAKGEIAGSQVVGPGEITDEVSLEQLLVEGEVAVDE
ncbi:hypothetical protein ACYFX5_05260 [Bremerella sp. T1]|nr:hypothetical protein [Bremerella volcania]